MMLSNLIGIHGDLLSRVMVQGAQVAFTQVESTVARVRCPIQVTGLNAELMPVSVRPSKCSAKASCEFDLIRTSFFDLKTLICSGSDD
jgi:hypothetical protein